MKKAYTITLVVEDRRNQYGDAQTLEWYFVDTVKAVTDALELNVIGCDVKGKRN